MVTDGSDLSGITKELELPESVEAPVASGDVIGRAVYKPVSYTHLVSVSARLKSVFLAVTREPISIKLFSSTNLVIRCIAKLSLLLLIL